MNGWLDILLFLEYGSKPEINLFCLICVCFSVESWGSVEEDMEDRDWPELLSDTSVVGGAGHGVGVPRLKRGQGSRHLGVDMTFNPDSEEGAEHGNKCFTSSGNRSCAGHVFHINMKLFI